MHMRFVRLKIDEDKIWIAKEFYRERVVSQLREIDGCLFAGLLHGTIHGGDIISMTVWTGADKASEYEHSGLFDSLLDESDERVLGAETKPSQLDGRDLVVFSGVEPEVETWEVAGEVDQEVLDRVAEGRVFVRMVSMRLRRDARDEFERRFEAEVRPVLADTPGCLATFLVSGLDDATRVLSVTVWAREEDAVRYGLSGEFERLTLRLRDTFSDLYQWNVALAEDPVTASMPSARTPNVEGYQLVVGSRLK